MRLVVVMACCLSVATLLGCHERTRVVHGRSTHGEAAPSWMESPVSASESRRVTGGPLVAVGRHVALAGYVPDVAAVELAGGLRGYVRLPDGAIWVGLSSADSLLAATKDGVLYAANDLDEALEGIFALRATIPGALSWDAAGDVVAVVTKKDVHVSMDGGHSFRTSSPTAHPLLKVLVQQPLSNPLISTALQRAA